MCTSEKNVYASVPVPGFPEAKDIIVLHTRGFDDGVDADMERTIIVQKCTAISTIRQYKSSSLF